MKKRIFLLCFFIFTALQPAEASHIIGAEINYSCLYSNSLGDSMQIDLYVYRDCSGIAAANQFTLSVHSFISYSSLTVNLLYCQPLSSACSGLSTCLGGAVYGVEKCIYRGNFFFQKSSSWFISLSLCCRNGSVTTVLNNNANTFYIESSLNNFNGCNNSAKLINDPVDVICIGEPFTINVSATDLDGDSLTYELVAPAVSPGVFVNYIPPYSYNQFLNGLVNFNFQNIYVSPHFQEISLYAVKITEYRAGQVVGTSIHDFQIYASPYCYCGQLPLLWDEIRGEYSLGCCSIYFSTYDEINTQYFQLEKSFNGTDFFPVSKCLACGSCDYKNEYTLKDCLPPCSGLTYYRVKQYDMDGAFSYSSIVVMPAVDDKEGIFSKWNILGQRIK